jgi:DNA-binding PadR family transcriptional regulator
MNSKNFNRQWHHHVEGELSHHQRGAWGGGWDGQTGRGRQGPPPWVAGLFGLARGPQGRGPRVRRGDVRAAVLDVLAAEPMNGYQVIQQITERTEGAWRPSPGSVYPTISQLEDEGLVEADAADGRRTLRLTAEGESYVAEHPEELAAVWKAFEQSSEEASDYAVLKP